MSIEDRVERLEAQVEELGELLEEIADIVVDMNNENIAMIYFDLVQSGKLEEMREKHPDEVEEMERVTTEFVNRVDTLTLDLEKGEEL